MKTIIITLMLALWACLGAEASNLQGCAATPDTIMARPTDARLLITEREDGVSIEVYDRLADTTIVVDRTYPTNASVYARLKRNSIYYSSATNTIHFSNPGSHWGVTSGQLTLGLVKALDAPEGCPLEWSKSIEVGWLNALAVTYDYGVSRFSLGLGFDWRNYKVSTATRLSVSETDGTLTWGPYPEGTLHKSSRIKVFSLGFPLLWRVSVPGTNLRIEAGAIFNLNTHASLKTKWLDTSSGNAVETYNDRIGQRRFTVDLYARIGLGSWIGLYARYGTRSVLRRSQPEFSPLSVGVVLF